MTETDGRRLVYTATDIILITFPDGRKVRSNELDVEPHIIIKGGPGSGHFGHAGRPGIRGGSLPGGGDVVWAMSSLDRTAFEEGLLRYDVPDEHLVGLRSISTEPYREGDWEAKEWPESDDMSYYYIEEKVITIDPRVLAIPAGDALLVHEIGHHVTQTYFDKQGMDDDTAIKWGAPVMKRIQGMSDRELASFGLAPGRRYASEENIFEVLADSYMSWMWSREYPEMRNNIKALWQSVGLDAEELFGK